MKFSDEMLMAYADGELDAALRADIEAAMATDPEVARTVGKHRAFAARIRGSYQDVLEEPVPDRLAALVKAAPTAPVATLAQYRKERPPAPTPVSRLPQWAALAASLVLGLLIGLLVMREPDAPWAESGAGLVARNDLDRALSTQLAGEDEIPDVRVGISFRDRDGAYCRAFHLQQRAPLAGLACRAGSGWQLEVLAAAARQEGELAPASAMPIAVLQAIDAAIDGEPLDAAGEAAARDAGWQATPKLAE